MKNNTNEKLAEDSFTYGNHKITISIFIKYTNHYSTSEIELINGVEGYRYYRLVNVEAEPIDGGRSDITNRTAAAVDVEQERRYISILGRKIGFKTGTKPPSIPDQVEATVRPVLTELDELYEYTAVDLDLDIEIAMDRVKHEMSWVDVEDEVDRMAKEIGSMAGESDG